MPVSGLCMPQCFSGGDVMNTKTDFRKESLWASGIAAACIIYTIIRMFFGYSVNDGFVDAASGTHNERLFVAVYGLAVAAVLIAYIFAAKKKVNSVPLHLLPFVMITALGQSGSCMLLGEADTRHSFAFLVLLFVAFVIRLTGIHFLGLVAVLAVFFISPIMTPPAAVLCCAMTVPFLNNKEEKKKNIALLCLSLQILSAVMLSVSAFRNVVIESGEFGAKQTTEALIFILPWSALWIFFAIKEKTTQKITEAAFLIAVPAAALITGAVVAGGSDTQMFVRISVAAAVLLFACYSADSNTLSSKASSFLTKNMPLYFLLLIFISRLGGFMYIFFEYINYN